MTAPCCAGCAASRTRMDQGIAFSSPVDAQGRLAAVIRKAGPMTYASRGVVEHVDARDLDDPAAIRTLIGSPLVLGHPPSGAASPRDAVGRILEARRDGDVLRATIEISDRTVRSLIEAGELSEFSAGYDVGRIDSNGYQRSISYDHVAILPPGASRCGSVCSISRADALEDDDEIGSAERARLRMIFKAGRLAPGSL